MENNNYSKWLWVFLGIIGIVGIWIYKVQTSTLISSLSALTSENRAVYAGPNVNYEVIGFLDENTEITLIGRNGDVWVTFNFKGKQGWIQVFFLDVDGKVSRLPDVKFIPVPTSTERPRGVTVDTNLLCATMFDRVGELVKCKIPRAYCTYRPDAAGNPTFCNDAPYPDHDFTLVIWGFDWSNVDGDCLIVEGIISRYEGKLQIEAEADEVNLLPCN